MANMKPESENVEKPSFEEALRRLERVVGQLEEGETGLDESLKAYEQGVKLLRQCYDMLEGAQRRIELLSGVDADGKPLTTPLDDESLSLDEKAKSRSRRRGARKPPKTPNRGSDADIDESGALF